jgi:hypothetical protein
MKRTVIAVGSILLAIGTAALPVAGLTSPVVMPPSLTPIADWNLEAQRAIVPSVDT